MRKSKQIRLLLVEDNKSYIQLTKEFLKYSNFNSVLNTVNDGIKVANFLYKHYKYNNRSNNVILDYRFTLNELCLNQAIISRN